MTFDSPGTKPRGSRFLTALRARWYLVALPVIAVPVMGLVFGSFQTPEYSASAKVLIKRDLGSQLVGLAQPTDDPLRAADTQAQFVGLPDVAKLVARDLGRPASDWDPLRKKISVTTDSQSDLLTITARTTNAAESMELANAFARASTAYRKTVEDDRILTAREGLTKLLNQSLADGSSDSALVASLRDRIAELKTLELLTGQRAVVVGVASEAPKVWPRPVRTALLGALVGLGLGLLYLYAWMILDRRVRTAADVADGLGTPLLGAIPNIRAQRDRPGSLVARDMPVSREAESYRIVEANLGLAVMDREHQLIVVSSLRAGEGKTTTAGNLAIAAAEAGRHTLLLDLDLRRPSVAAYFGLSRQPGFTDVVRGAVSIDDAVQLEPGGSTEFRGAPLSILTSGALPPNPIEYLGSAHARGVLRELSSQFDLVLIDAPPLEGLGDVIALSAACDGLIAIVDVPDATTGRMEDLRKILSSLASPVIGVVAVRAPRLRSEGYYSVMGDATEQSRTPLRHEG